MNNEETSAISIDEDDFGFDPSDFPGFEEPQEAPAEEPAAAEPESEGEGTEEGEGGGEEAPAEQEEKFELSDGSKVSRADVLELAFKGRSADQTVQQLRAQLDEAASFRQQHESVVSMLTEMAADAKMDLPAFAASLRENFLISTTGMNRESAKVEAKKWLDGHSEKIQAAQQQAQARKDAQDRANRDLAEFRKRYPGVDTRDRAQVPQSVWDEVFSGKSTLTDAYGRYQLQQLKAENEKLKAEQVRAEKHKDNVAKSVGSAKSAGKETHDAFLAGFNEDY